ncbi:MAG: hypothetical protein ACYDCQ_01505 [Dehalococcoidia bacterium]
MSTAISLLATIVTFVFAGAVLRQHLRRPRLYRLIWALALLFYGVATLVQFLAETGGWSLALFRLWYLSGGLLTAAYLGQGTACLLLGRRTSRFLLLLLIFATVWSVWRTATVSLTLHAILPPAGRVSPNAAGLPGDLRALAALLNIYGTLLLIGGAVWSAVVYWDRMLDKRRAAGYRALSTLLIAGGSLVVAAAGSLETLGHGEYLYAAEIVGISIIFVGFLRSQEAFPLVAPRLQHPADVAPAAPVASPAAVRHLRRVSDRVSSHRR